MLTVVDRSNDPLVGYGSALFQVVEVQLEV